MFHPTQVSLEHQALPGVYAFGLGYHILCLNAVDEKIKA